jgi:hypothetical protein
MLDICSFTIHRLLLTGHRDVWVWHRQKVLLVKLLNVVGRIYDFLISFFLYVIFFSLCYKTYDKETALDF